MYRQLILQKTIGQIKLGKKTIIRTFILPDQ